MAILYGEGNYNNKVWKTMKYDDSIYSKCNHIIGHDKDNKIVDVEHYDIAFDRRVETYNWCPKCGLQLFVVMKYVEEKAPWQT